MICQTVNAKHGSDLVLLFGDRDIAFSVKTWEQPEENHVGIKMQPMAGELPSKIGEMVSEKPAAGVILAFRNREVFDLIIGRLQEEANNTWGAAKK